MLKRMQTVSALAASTVISLAALSSVQASLLYYEGFNYTPGPATDPPTPWNRNQPGYGGSQSSTLDAGSVGYPNLAASGNHLAQNDPDGGGAFPYTVNDTVTGANAMFSVAGTYYYTMVGQIQTDVAADNLDGLGSPVLFSNPGGNGYGVEGYVQLGAQSNTGGEIVAQLEVGNTLGGSTFFAAPSVVHPGPFFFAVRVVNDGTAAADDVRLVFNPDLSLGEPDWNSPTLSVTNRNITSSVSSNALIYIGRNHLWDEIRVATTWGEAAPSVPEPIGSAVCALFTWTLAMTRKRR